MKSILVCGAGGFIGSHLVNKLKADGYWVRGVDLLEPSFEKSTADDFVIGDLRDPVVCNAVLDRAFDEVYQLAADMGGAGFLFTGDNDADVMHNSAMINLNIAHRSVQMKVGKLFYSSSACVYPEENQMDPDNPKCTEDTVYPANPDSEYGWEKLFGERMYLAFNRNYNLDVRIARFHNIFGPLGTWQGGREKVPAALCRKIAQAEDGGEIEIWGDGLQTRSFLYVEECVEAMQRFMQSDFQGPINIGSDEMVSINTLANMIADVAGKSITIKNIPGPLGVRGRTSDNALIADKLSWSPSQPLSDGLAKAYKWIDEQVKQQT